MCVCVCVYVCVFPIVRYTVPLMHNIVGLVCAYSRVMYDLFHPQVFHHWSGQDCRHWCRHPQLEQEHYPKGTVPAPEFHLEVIKGTMSLYVSSKLVNNFYRLFLPLHSHLFQGVCWKTLPYQAQLKAQKLAYAPEFHLAC